MNPLISIVVPVYNVENYIVETIESVIAQTYSNWELWLIDDGSTDASSDKIKPFTIQHENIHYLRKENGGQASARNLGIKNAKGEYVAFLDSDDFWAPEKLAQQIEELKEFQPDFLYGMGYYYFENENGKTEPYSWISGLNTGKDFFQILYHSSAVNTNSVLVRKELFEKVGYFNENELLRGTEDWDLWMRIAKNVQTVYGSPSRNVYYRLHDGGIHFQNARMFRGKTVIYAQYDNDTSISRQRRLKQYRWAYRELLNSLYDENKASEIDTIFQEYKAKDKWGLTLFFQRIIYPITNWKIFNWLSRKVIYRIGYRLEKLSYWLFLKDSH